MQAGFAAPLVRFLGCQPRGIVLDAGVLNLESYQNSRTYMLGKLG